MLRCVKAGAPRRCRLCSTLRTKRRKPVCRYASKQSVPCRRTRRRRPPQPCRVRPTLFLGGGPCDPNHIHRPSAIVACRHEKRVSRANSEDTTMTSFLRLSGLKAIALSATFMTVGLAIAGEMNVSADQILHALQPKLSAARSTRRSRPRKSASSNRCATAYRSLSLGERGGRSRRSHRRLRKIDLDIQFDYNSADIRPSSIAALVQELGKALSNASLKGSTFVVAGHTDAIGGESYNQDPSQRRAATIKRYLTEKYGLNGSDRHRRLWQDQAEGSERADGPDQPPRSGRQHGYQDRGEVTAAVVTRLLPRHIQRIARSQRRSMKEQERSNAFSPPACRGSRRVTTAAVTSPRSWYPC